MKRMGLLFAVLYLSGLLIGSVRAGGGLSGGATEFTQIANNSELIVQVGQLAEQINQQIQMVQDMIHNTLALPKKLIGDITGAIDAVMGAYNDVQGILNRLSNIDEEFYNMFYSELQSLGWTENYSEKYFELSKGLEKEAKKRIESLKVAADDITDSSKILEKLSNNANSAEGRNAIEQAGNEFLGFMGGELVKVRALLVEQTKAYMDYAERQKTIEDAAFDVHQKDLEKMADPTHTPVMHKNSSLKW